MTTIHEFKNMLRQIEKDVLAKSNQLKDNDLYLYDIFLISVEEDIALWRIEYKYNYYYIYTDLEGKLLFNGKKFKYATPFSNSRAYINNYRECLILDLEKKEMIVIPEELTFGNINKFRNNELALFNNNMFKWGSVKYDTNENIFKEDIPFIWDALEFSRLKDQVYVGIHNISSITNNHPYFHWSDDFGKMFIISSIRLPLDKARDLDYYERVKKAYMNVSYQKVIQYIRKEISSDVPKEKRDEIIKDYIITAYNIGDYYFKEEYKEEINNNKGEIVDVGNFNDYQKKLGRFIKNVKHL